MKNPYRKKRNKTTIIYLLTMAAAFLLGMGMIGLNELTGVKLFYTLGMIFTMIDALGMILLVPLLIRIVKLTKQAKMHDEAQAAPPSRIR